MTDTATQPPTPTMRRLSLAAIWMVALGLLAWVLTRVPLSDLWLVIRRLSIAQIALLLALNACIVLAFSLRWWLLLGAMGHRLPFVLLSLHRLAGYGVSYFTPGPQLGGEPVQVLLARKRHGVPAFTSVASVALDRLLEVSVNLSLLVVGLIVALQVQWAGGNLPAGVLGAVALLLLLPVAYLFLLWGGRTPLTRLLRRLPAGLHDTSLYVRASQAAQESERQAGALLRNRPMTILAALAASLLSWLGMIGEYWLMLRFLGVSLTPLQLISVIAAARVAILMPMPGGLGTLEAGQVFIFQALGLDPALGLSASLLIRARDVLFGLAGLWWAGKYWQEERRRAHMATITVTRRASAPIPTVDGEFDLVLYTTNQDNKEHLALLMGEPGANQPVLARVHSECFTGDVLGSLRCDCGGQLARAMQMVAKNGAGVILYLRQEGRGIGLLDKLRAYALQDEGYDTVDANLLLGHAPDERDYTIAARIFEDLGVKHVRLMTNNPEKIDSLRAQGIQVTARVPLQTDAHPQNLRYLLTKAYRMDHLLDVGEMLPTWSPNGSNHTKETSAHDH